jgi:helicase
VPIRSLTYAEDAAFAAQRSLAGYDVASSDLLSFARRLITEALDEAPDSEETDVIGWENHNRRKLDSAARVITSIAGSIEADSDLRGGLLLLATLAFCLDGNHVAGNLVGKLVLLELPSNDVRLVPLGLGCPRLAISCTNHCADLPDGQAILRTAHASIALPNAAVPEFIPQVVAFEVARRTPGLGYMLGLALRSNEAARELRFDFVLDEFGFPLKQAILANLARRGRFLLLPSQRAALREVGVLATTTSALITLPTGAGKTLVGLLSIASSLADARDVGVFLAPYLAIRRQVAQTAQEILAGVVTVVEGRQTVDTGQLPTLIVDTPEAFDWKLRRDHSLRRRLKCVVFDEAHLLGSDSRGILADSVLTRLVLGEGGVARPKRVLLSAVLDEDDSIVSWLSSETAAVRATSRWRPSARRIGVWRPDGTLEWMRTLGAVTGHREVHIVARGRIAPAHRYLAAGHPMQMSGTRYTQCDANAALLGTELWAQSPQSTLFIVGTRARARSLAKELGKRILPSESVREGRVELIQQIRSRYREFADLVPLIERGVAYHSALLPSELRAAIERCCSAGDLDFVCATTSLAEGADLPFGRCILADWTFPVGNGQHRPFPPALWRNIAGRCGRPTSHIEGETIVIEESPPVAFGSSTERSRALRAMITGFVKVESSLRESSERIAPVREQLLSQTLITVIENPTQNEIHTSLIDHLLASQLAGPEVALATKAFVENRLLGGSEPLAARGSPLSLTAKGRTVMMCRVLPGTADDLLGMLRTDSQFSTPAALCDAILRATAECVELQQTALPRVCRGTSVQNLWVRDDDLLALCDQWLLGATIGDLLTFLAVRRNRTAAERRRLSEWLSGDAEPGEWLARYEKLVEFARSVLAEYLPRAIAATALLASEMVPDRTWLWSLDDLRRNSELVARGLHDADEQ